MITISGTLTTAEREFLHREEARAQAAYDQHENLAYTGLANVLNAAEKPSRARHAATDIPATAVAAHNPGMSSYLADLVEWAKTTEVFGPDDYRYLRELASAVTLTAGPAGTAIPLIDELALALAAADGCINLLPTASVDEDDPYFRDAKAVLPIVNREKNAAYAEAMNEAIGLVGDMTDSRGNTYGTDLKNSLAHQRDLALESDRG
jgi:hypothetical protein